MYRALLRWNLTSPRNTTIMSCTKGSLFLWVGSFREVFKIKKLLDAAKYHFVTSFAPELLQQAVGGKNIHPALFTALPLWEEGW